ncbi:MAG: DUF4962 domain-containing protein [Candidatus Sumerlaeota bacterium]|nr:DUF4962 domain-containing protein [Candidatus Sumerlaeota bacterium]
MNGRLWIAAALLASGGSLFAAEEKTTPAPLFHWEAEALTIAGAEPETDYNNGASGGQYVYLPKAQKDAKAPPQSSLTAEFDAAPGRYLVRVRALAVNGGSDSVFLFADGQRVETGKFAKYGEWVWLEAPVALAAAGPHSLVLAPREPARIDAVEILPAAGGELMNAVAIRQSIPTVPEPNDSRPLDVNPPTFRWVGKWDQPYTLQLARADAPWREAQEVADIQETFYRPLQPLAAGPWKWRVQPQGDPWLPEQRFDVKEDTARWPIPPWRETYERFPQEHPRLWLRKDELPALRERLAAADKDLVANFTRQLEKTLGAKLSLEEDKAAKKTEDRKSSTIQRTASKKDAGDMMGPVGNLAFFAVLMSRDDFAQEAIRRAMAATQLDPKGYTSQRVSDFANGNIVKNVALAYDLLYDRLTPEQRQAMLDCLHARIAGVYKPELEQRLYSAHCWQRVFLDLSYGALAAWDADPEMAEWLRWAAKITVATYPWYGGADGASEEGGQYFTGTDMLSSLEMVRFWKRACGLELTGNPWFGNDPWYVVYSCPLTGPTSRFGDHSPDKSNPNAQRAMAALMQADQYGNPFAAAYAKAVIEQLGEPAFRRSGPGDTAFARLWLTDGPFGRTPPKPLADLPAAHVFPDTGLAFIHSAFADPGKNVMFEFRSSPYGAFNHAHADQNSFNISAYGEELIIDSGHYTSFGDAHHYGFTVKQKAHNLILVDGQDEPSRELEAYGQIIGFAQGKDWAWVLGDAKTAYFKTPLERQCRQCVWLGGGETQTFVIFDSIAAKDGKPHRYEWLLHSANPPELDEAAQKALLATEKAQARVTWLAPRGLKYSLTDQFDPPAENWRPDKQKIEFPNQWHMKAAPAEGAPSQAFLTVIQVGPKGAEPPAQPALDGETGLRVGDWQLLFSDDGVKAARGGQTVFEGKAGQIAGDSPRP